jgi:glycosyltransferase involved in cell wall biosynthesis
MIKVTEYAALGKPIVAFDLKETRYSAGEAALYAPPNDDAAYAAEIERLLARPELREQLGAAGRRRAAELSWERSERALLAAYERALERERGTAGLPGGANGPP